MPSPEYFNMMNQLENIRHEQQRTADALKGTGSSGGSARWAFSFNKAIIAIIVILILGGLSFLILIGGAFLLAFTG